MSSNFFCSLCGGADRFSCTLLNHTAVCQQCKNVYSPILQGGCIYCAEDDLASYVEMFGIREDGKDGSDELVEHIASLDIKEANDGSGFSNPPTSREKKEVKELEEALAKTSIAENDEKREGKGKGNGK